jgi:hypothetical protein
MLFQAVQHSEPNEAAAKLKETLAQFEEKGLTREGDGWSVRSELGTLQPQRIRILKPIFAIATESAVLTLSAKIYADGLAQPISLAATLALVAESIDARVEELVPDLETRIPRMRLRSERHAEVLSARRASA